MSWHEFEEPLEALTREISAFLEADTLDRSRFMRLVDLLHALTPEERDVAYRHMLEQTTHAKMSAADDERVRALLRLADFVRQDPPAPGTRYGAELLDESRPV